MTAIGFLLVVIAILLGWLDGFIDLPDRVAKAMGIIAVAGVVMFMAGVTVWIWRVMP